MEVKIKKLNENAVIPRYAHPTDAGLDQSSGHTFSPSHTTRATGWPK